VSLGPSKKTEFKYVTPGSQNKWTIQIPLTLTVTAVKNGVLHVMHLKIMCAIARYMLIPGLSDETQHSILIELNSR
jgi:hypothetical protein